MPDTNGHGPRRAALYARVSTDEQARSGYSLAQQIEALRAYAAQEGYEVLEEVSDPGHSGASLERPGMDRVRDLVATGGVSVVLAQDRDRIAREPAYHYLLRREFEEHGTRIRALNDRGDESPEGELTDGILDQLAKFERAKTAERTRRGKLRKAREGKVIASKRPTYGFRYNEARDNLVVAEEEMRVVSRIIHMIGEEGASLNAVKRVLEGEGLPSPDGKKNWGKLFIRECVRDDVYREHGAEEIGELVARGQMAPEVAARLDSEKSYGVWWFNRNRVKTRHVAERGPDGTRYRKRATYTPKPPGEWVAVPIPASGIPPAWIDAALATLEKNARPSRNGGRFWELSGGIARCAECGWSMRTSTVASSTTPKKHHYYRCMKVHARYQNDPCTNRKSHRADKLESAVWDYVFAALQEPAQLRADLDAYIELERSASRGNPHEEARVWAGRRAEIEEKRARYQEMTASGLITFDELRDRLSGLDEARRTTERELGALRERRERVEELERARDGLLDSLEAMAPEVLGCLNPEERRHFYGLLSLRVLVHGDGTQEVLLSTPGTNVCTSETVPW